MMVLPGFAPFFFGSRKALRAVALMLAALIGGAAAGFAQSAPGTISGYPLAPGDVLHIDFLAQPSFGRDMVIEVDGRIELPLVGPVQVEGRTIAELRAEVPVLLAGAVIRSRGNNGDELIPVRPEEVQLDVARYRPVYVDGAVRDPGEIPFQVGMTVREALAKARGVGVPTTRSATLDAATETDLLAELGATLADKAITEALLTGAETLDLSALDAVPLGANWRAAMRAGAEARFGAEREMRAVADRGADLKIQGIEDRIVDALRQKENLTQIAINEESNVRRMETLARRGAASDEALTAGKRAWLQALEKVSTAQSDAVKGQETRRAQEQESAEQLLKRKIGLLTQLDAQTSAEARLRDKLGYVLDPAPGAASGLKIYRRGAALDASFDTPLMPADVIAVSRGELQ